MMRKGISHDTFNIADPSSMQERVTHVNLVKWPSSPRISR